MTSLKQVVRTENFIMTYEKSCTPREKPNEAPVRYQKKPITHYCANTTELIYVGTIVPMGTKDVPERNRHQTGQHPKK